MKKGLLLLYIALLFLLCGCASREINRGYLVSAIGFSAGKGNTTKIYVEALSSSDMIDKPSEKAILTAAGTSVQNAFENLKQTLVKPLYFEQLGTVIFEKDINNASIEFLKNIPNINYGIYLVKTDNIDKLFKVETPSGLLGYDVIGLLKTNEKTKNQLYKLGRDDFLMPTIKWDGNQLLFSEEE